MDELFVVVTPSPSKSSWVVHKGFETKLMLTAVGHQVVVGVGVIYYQSQLVLLEVRKAVLVLVAVGSVQPVSDAGIDLVVELETVLYFLIFLWIVGVSILVRFIK